MSTKEAMAIAFAQECLRTYLDDMDLGISISNGDKQTADVFLHLYKFALDYFDANGIK